MEAGGVGIWWIYCGCDWEVIGGGPVARWCAGSRLCKFLMEIYSKVVPKLAGIRWMGVESGGIHWV